MATLTSSQSTQYRMKNGDRHLLCEAPEGPFRQKVPVTFFHALQMKSIAGIVCTVSLCCLVGLAGSPVCAQWSSPGESQTEWNSGKRLQDELARPGNCLWQDAPLRTALGSFSRARRVALIIDRRVDPGQLVNLKLTNATGEQVLARVAEERDLGFCLFGPVAYFGPRSTTDRIRTVGELRREELRGLRSDVAKKFLASKPAAWGDLATPRDLLSELGAENRFEISGLERIPHDLWAAADLPALTVSDRLTLILAQFDLTFNVAHDGSSVTLVPMPEHPVVVRDYPGGLQPDELAGKWSQLVPDCRFKVVNGRVYVQGRLEGHERIGVTLRPPQRKTLDSPPPDLDRMRFKTNAPNQPLEKVLTQFASQLKLELKLDRAAFESAGVSLDQLVSFSVEDATFDQLMDAVVGPAGCTWRREGNLLEVRPAQK